MQQIAHSIDEIVTRMYAIDSHANVERPDPQFGDVTTNVALQLATSLARSPREIAEEIADALRQERMFRDVAVAGPGFINLRLQDADLREWARQSVPQVAVGTNMVVEYSCPNAFKELHTGHLYQTVFGDILCRILEATGARVTRTSFGGDVGLHGQGADRA